MLIKPWSKALPTRESNLRGPTSIRFTFTRSDRYVAISEDLTGCDLSRIVSEFIRLHWGFG